MGFRVALYTSGLFSRDSCDLRPRIQYSFRSCRSRCFLLVVICLRQVSRRSRCMPKYLTSSGWTRYVLFSWTGGHEGRLMVKVTWVAFVSLAFIRHICMSNRAVCSLCVAISGLAWTARTAVSSVKVAVPVSAVAGTSAE
jgi:hypothetical protein